MTNLQSALFAALWIKRHEDQQNRDYLRGLIRKERYFRKTWIHI